MKAGRELDALIAEKIMGWTVAEIPVQAADFGKAPYLKRYYVSPSGSRFARPLDYSTNIADAWKVVEKAHRYTISKMDGFYNVLIVLKGNRLGNVEAENICEAVCLAALKAVSNE